MLTTLSDNVCLNIVTRLQIKIFSFSFCVLILKNAPYIYSNTVVLLLVYVCIYVSSDISLSAVAFERVLQIFYQCIRLNCFGYNACKKINIAAVIF